LRNRETLRVNGPQVVFRKIFQMDWPWPWELNSQAEVAGTFLLPGTIERKGCYFSTTLTHILTLENFCSRFLPLAVPWMCLVITKPRKCPVPCFSLLFSFHTHSTTKTFWKFLHLDAISIMITLVRLPSLSSRLLCFSNNLPVSFRMKSPFTFLLDGL
jgi:hypothetical protein